MSTVLEDEEPTKTIMGFATLLAEDGRPMHKSWGNFIEFNEGAEKMGVDVMRWIYVRQNISENLLFGYKLADETRRRFHLKLWNVYNFFVTYANIDNWRPGGKIEKANLLVLDKWILLRLEELVREVTESLDRYDAAMASGLIEAFVDDLSNWYLRRSRDRVGPLAENKLSKEAFYQTLYLVLEVLSRLLAPFTPFISDKIYCNLTKKESVHLSEWPHLDFGFLEGEKNLVEDMVYLRDIVEKVHAKRKELGIPVRQPLIEAIVMSPDKRFEKVSVDLFKIAEDELNVKRLTFKFAKEESVEMNTKITPELEEEAKARELLRQIQEERKKMNISFTQPSIVYSPWLPKNKQLLQMIMKKSSSSKILKDESFRVETVNEK